MGPYAFLSYSTKDTNAAKGVCDALERRGVGVWMAPRNVEPGSNYAASIIDAIDGSCVLVLTLSRASNNSADVEREVKRASDNLRPIIPFRIEQVEPSKSLSYFLGSSQYLDAFTPPMEAHYEALAKVVQRIAPAGLAPSAKCQGPPAPLPRSTELLPIMVPGIVAILVGVALASWQIWERPSQSPGGMHSDTVETRLASPSEESLAEILAAYDPEVDTVENLRTALRALCATEAQIRDVRGNLSNFQHLIRFYQFLDTYLLGDTRLSPEVTGKLTSSQLARLRTTGPCNLTQDAANFYEFFRLPKGLKGYIPALNHALPREPPLDRFASVADIRERIAQVRGAIDTEKLPFKDPEVTEQATPDLTANLR